MSNKPRFKLAVIGSRNVGVTSLVRQYLKLENPEEEVNNSSAETYQLNTKTYDLDILAATSDELTSLNDKKFAEYAFIVCYDITNQESYNRAKQWVSQIKAERLEPVILVGTKSDLEETDADLEQKEQEAQQLKDLIENKKKAIKRERSLSKKAKKELEPATVSKIREEYNEKINKKIQENEAGHFTKEVLARCIEEIEAEYTSKIESLEANKGGYQQINKELVDAKQALEKTNTFLNSDELRRKVAKTDAEQFAKKNEINYFETSTKDNKSIAALFDCGVKNAKINTQMVELMKLYKAQEKRIFSQPFWLFNSELGQIKNKLLIELMESISFHIQEEAKKANSGTTISLEKVVKDWNGKKSIHGEKDNATLIAEHRFYFWPEKLYRKSGRRTDTEIFIEKIAAMKIQC